MLVENFIISVVIFACQASFWYTVCREVLWFIVHSEQVEWHNDEHFSEFVITG